MHDSGALLRIEPVQQGRRVDGRPRAGDVEVLGHIAVQGTSGHRQLRARRVGRTAGTGCRDRPPSATIDGVHSHSERIDAFFYGYRIAVPVVG